MANLNRRSRLITAGVARSPNRAMLRAVGFKDGDFEKPIVGVANGHSTMNPCNAGIQPLVDRVMAAAQGSRSNAAGLRLSDRDRRHRHGHRRHEVFAGIARSHCRLNRGRGQRPAHGRCGCGWRLRQEHAGKHDGHGAHERAGNFRVRRHHQAGLLERREAHDREPVRGGGRVHRRQDVAGRLRRHREKRLPVSGRLRRPVHRKHNVVLVRSARHEPARLIADGIARRREGRLRSRVRSRAGRGGSQKPEAARHHHQKVDRECGCARHGDRRLDQCGAPLSCHRQCGGREMDHRRLRARAAQSAGAVQSQALGPRTWRRISMPRAACRRC